MEKMNDLRDLLRYSVANLYAAEQQIIEALPKMIEKTNSLHVRQALETHLEETRTHIGRLDSVQTLLGEPRKESNDMGWFSRMTGINMKAKGLEGIINEGQMIMGQDMAREVMDAAIISSAQTVEHYEICGYGTAHAFARQLGLTEIANLLDQTLQEERKTDELLTELAMSSVNLMAELP